MLASRSDQRVPKNYRWKCTKASPINFEVACTSPHPPSQNPPVCWACSIAAGPGSLCWWLPKVLRHSGKMNLTSVFYLLMSNHHLYLSPAWDSAAWNTNAIRNWSPFWKTHIHLAKPCLTHWHLWLPGSFGNTWPVTKCWSPFQPTPPWVYL